MPFLAASLAAVAFLSAASGAAAQYTPTPQLGGSLLRWEFAGCVSSEAASTYDGYSEGLATTCANTVGPRWVRPWATSELNGRQPDGATRCSDPAAPFAAWCAVSTGAERNRCVQSCADGGAFVLATDTTFSGNGKIACLGPDSYSCTWFEDAECKILRPLAKPAITVAEGVRCRTGGRGSNWCREAYDQIHLGKPQTDCSAGLPPPDTTCEATIGGPDLEGSEFVCFQDGHGLDTFVPVKLTKYNQVACQSRNSRDCIWVSRSCCEKLAATADSTTPYLEAGVQHEAVWGDDGFVDPLGWATLARNSFAANPPKPAQRPDESGVEGEFRGCEADITSRCNDRPDTQLQLAFSTCMGQAKAYKGFSAYGGPLQCPDNVGRVLASCVAEFGSRYKQPACSRIGPMVNYKVRAPEGDGCKLGPDGADRDRSLTICAEVCGNVTDGRGSNYSECREDGLFWCYCTKYL
ncbi:hypothetical protein DFJ74DRAFT_645200 [Hyaloraphidium curvatum]|nr:hypothetical protein DFJ74DRAFT_645200 [Hyaloraphidium curvatum]